MIATLIVTLVEAALRGLLLAATVGLALTLLRVRNVPARKAAWTLVLLASAAMPLLMRWAAVASWPQRFAVVLPVHTMPIAVPHQQSAAAPAPVLILNTQPAVTSSAERDTNITAVPVASASLSPAVQPMQQPWHWPPPLRLMAWVYCAVAGALLLRLMVGLAAAARLWATAALVSPLITPEPGVRASARITSPVNVGSGIVLPADYAAWDRIKLRTVIAHERSHVRQMDFWLQLAASLYTAFFWFSPLGWLLRRSLASLGEAIADRSGMEAAASRAGYAEIVLQFAAMPRRNLPGVAMARKGNISRRIESMLNERVFRSAFAEGRRRAAVALLLIPAAIFAVTALVRVPAAAAQEETGAVPMAVPVGTAPPAPVVVVEQPASDEQTAPPAPVEPDAAAQAAAPAPSTPAATPQSSTPPQQPESDGSAAAAQRMGDDSAAQAVTSADTNTNTNADARHTDAGNDYAWSWAQNADSWALVEGPGTKYFYFGHWDNDVRAQIDAARSKEKGPFLLIRHEGEEYIIDDPAILARIKSLYQPMDELGAKQEALGKQQEELGKRMEELSRAQQSVAKIQLPDLSKEMADLNAAMASFKADQEKWSTQEMADMQARIKADVEAKLASQQGQMVSAEKLAEIQAKLAAAQASISAESMARVQAKIAELQGRLGELQGEAGSRQGEFGEKMGQLGEAQGKLGEQQGKLGAEQGRIAEQAARVVKSIIDQALHDGTAKPAQ